MTTEVTIELDEYEAHYMRQRQGGYANSLPLQVLDKVHDALPDPDEELASEMVKTYYDALAVPTQDLKVGMRKVLELVRERDAS